MFSMHPNKVAGQNGFNLAFFQSFWSVAPKDVCRACLQCLNEGAELLKKNHINIILLPKKKLVKTVTHLRPISLCNVIDKVVTKAVANRLKQMLPSIMSESQSVFIPGRSITDNVMITFVVIHCLNQKTRGKMRTAALKTNISKSYDRVKWRFL